MRAPWQAAIDELRRYVDRVASAIVEFSPLSSSSATGETDGVRAGAQSSDQRPVRRVSPFGFMSRPPEGLLAAVVKAFGGASGGMAVGVADTRYAPTSLVAGETALYCIDTDTTIKLDKNGKITITAGTSSVSVTKDGAIAVASGAGASVTIDAGAAANVVVNGGAFNVARAGTTDTAGPYPIVGGALRFKA